MCRFALDYLRDSGTSLTPEHLYSIIQETAFVLQQVSECLLFAQAARVAHW